MNTKALLSTSLLRRACMLGIVLSVAILTTDAQALPEPKVTVVYSLRVPDGGAYWQEISGTLSGLGDAYYVANVADSMAENVTVSLDDPLLVTMEFTADDEGNIIEGAVELTDTHFERAFAIDSGVTVVTTVLSTVLSRVATGTLSGQIITWDNVVGVNAYQELVAGEGNCTFSGDIDWCSFAGLWPRDLGGTFEVPLPLFTTATTFRDEFASDNNTPGLPADDIVKRDDEEAYVTDTWEGVEFVPEPSREILLLAGALGLAGLSRLRERRGAAGLFANRR